LRPKVAKLKVVFARPAIEPLRFTIERDDALEGDLLGHAVYGEVAGAVGGGGWLPGGGLCARSWVATA
jgi:hypothetical protein